MVKMFYKVLFILFFCAVTSANPGTGNRSLSKDGRSSSAYELIILVLIWICVLLLVLTLFMVCARFCWRYKNKRRRKNMDVESEENWIDCSTYKYEMIKKPTDSFEDLNKNPKLIDDKNQDDENLNPILDEDSERSNSEMVPSVDWKSPEEKKYSIETVDQIAVCVVHEAFKPVDYDDIDLKNLTMKLKKMKLTRDQENIVDSFLEDVLEVKMPEEKVKTEYLPVTTELQKELYKDFRNSIKSIELDAFAECTSLVTTNTENEFQENDETEPSNEPEPAMGIQQGFVPSSSNSNPVDELETENSSDDEFSTHTLPLSSPVSQVPRVESHSIKIENPPTLSCEDGMKTELTKSRIPFIELLRIFDPNKVQVPVCAVESQDNLSQLVTS